MKCGNCSFDNLPDSVFCQKCGTPLKKHSTDKPKTKEKSFRQEIEKIDDVIFHPKKKSSSVGNIIKLFLIVGGIGFVGLVGLIILDSSYSEEVLPTDKTTNTVEIDLTSFPVSYLEIKDLDSEWIGQQFYVKGILKNSHSSPALDVRVRVDFYKDEDLQELFDTRYVTILVVPANGAYSFKEPVFINPYDGQFWYITRIESAEY